MAVANGDLIQLIDYQTYLGQVVENVYYYRATEGLALSSNPYGEIEAAWSSQVLSHIRDMQSIGLTHTGLQIKNLSNGVDFFEDAYTATGAVSSTPSTDMPSYVSQGFKLVRESLATRNGYKRIAGIVDTLVAGNVFSFPSPAVKAAVLAGLSADLLTGVLVIAAPIIVKRPIAVPAGGAYIFSNIGTAQAATFLGSQNTRKPGRGN